MKILWVSDPPEAPTGFGNITHFICKGLAKEGCDIHIVCGGETNQTRRWQGCVVHTVRTFDYGANAVLNLLPHLRPDYLVTVGDPRWFIAFAKLGGEHEIHRYGSRWILYYPLDGELEDGSIPSDWRHIIELCDIPVAASHYTHELSRRCNIGVEMIPHGVSTNIFIPPTDKEAAKDCHGYRNKFVILSDARNQPRKMLPRLLEIFAEFSRTRPDSILHLHCDPADPSSGTDSNRLQSLINEMGIHNQTRFTTNFRYNKGLHVEDLAKLYQAADVHLLVSGGEGFGLPTLQAASTAVVPFAPNYSANPELIADHGELIKVQTFMRGRFGIRRAIVDIDDAVERLTRYYNERLLLVTVGARARIAALSYDWSLIIPMWLKILKHYKNNSKLSIKQNPWLSREEVVITGNRIQASSHMRQMLGPITDKLPLGARLRLHVNKPILTSQTQSIKRPKYPDLPPPPKSLASFRIVQFFGDKYTHNAVPDYDNGLYCWLLNCDAYGTGLSRSTGESEVMKILTNYDVLLFTLFRAWIGWIRRIRSKWTGKIIGLSDPPLSEIMQWPAHTQKEFLQDLNHLDGVLTLTRYEEQFFKQITSAPILYMGLPFPFKYYQAVFNFEDVHRDDRLITLGVGGSLADRNFLSNILVYRALLPKSKLHAQILSIFDQDIAEVSHIQSLASDVDMHVRTGREEYLKRLASSRMIINLTTRNSPGRIAGEAAFLGVPCIGSNELELQTICWPELAVRPFDIEGAIRCAERLMMDPDFYLSTVNYAQRQLRQFDEEHTLARLYLFLDQVISHKKPTG